MDLYFTNALSEIIKKYFDIDNPRITSVDLSFSPRSWRILAVHIENENSLVMSFDVLDGRCIIDRYTDPQKHYNVKTGRIDDDVSINYVCAYILYAEHINRVEEFGFPFETFKKVNSIIKEHIDDLWH